MMSERAPTLLLARPAARSIEADYGFVATMDRLVRRDPERYVGYGITDSWDEIVETLQGAPVSTDTELGAHMREFESLVRRIQMDYTRWMISMGIDSYCPHRVNMLFRDRRTHAQTRRSWRRGCACPARLGYEPDSTILPCKVFISLRTTVYAQMEEITELQSADRRRQRAMSELLETDRRRREEMRELRAADRTRQQQIVQTLTAVQTLQREMVPLQGLDSSDPLESYTAGAASGGWCLDMWNTHVRLLLMICLFNYLGESEEEDD
ncbi:hypothetical protein Tco_0795836 [Tanacetum coccineum]